VVDTPFVEFKYLASQYMFLYIVSKTFKFSKEQSNTKSSNAKEEKKKKNKQTSKQPKKQLTKKQKKNTYIAFFSFFCFIVVSCCCFVLFIYFSFCLFSNAFSFVSIPIECFALQQNFVCF
jgi:quinol-cytochrome oxidoreductase complex cytochrome b subunit